VGDFEVAAGGAATPSQIEQNFRRIRGGKHLPLVRPALSNKLHTTAA